MKLITTGKGKSKETMLASEEERNRALHEHFRIRGSRRFWLKAEN
jgi:hypothetical protein